MKVQARNSLLMWKSVIAASRVAGSPELSSWVWVIPLPAGGFRIRAFEVPTELVVAEASIYDGDLIIVHDEIISSIDEVDSSVLRAGVDPDELDSPWKCDFPL